MSNIESLAPVRRPASVRTRIAAYERQFGKFAPPCRPAVIALASKNSRLADLSLSFPALLFALAVRKPQFDAEPAIRAVIGGASLRTVSEMTQIPLWMRKLPPQAFSEAIADIPRSGFFSRQIANYIPSDPAACENWLRAVQTAMQTGNEAIAIWAARERRNVKVDLSIAQLRYTALWAWYSSEGMGLARDLIRTPWRPQANFETVANAAKRWLEMLNAHFLLRDVVPALPWFRPGDVNGLTFVHLATAEQIVEAAEVMNNCLASYAEDVALGNVQLWSVNCGSRCVAVLSVGAERGDPFLQVTQIRRCGNDSVFPAIAVAARRWAGEQGHVLLRDLPNSDSAPVSAKCWRNTWRPYWLAKQRIPKWLPLVPQQWWMDTLMSWD
jgi:hypothetical protein